MRDKKSAPWRGILPAALANFDSWLHSPRTLLMLLFIAAICYLQMCGYGMTLEDTGYTMHMGETLFYEFNFGCNMPVTSVLFLIMVSELPRKTAYQQYLLLRSSRCRWMAAQLLYGLMMVASMILLMLVCIFLAAIPLVTPGAGWSDAARIASGQIEPYEALVDAFILDHFSPWTALLLSLLPVFCFWLTMVFVILLFGVWGAPIVGVLAYASLLVANVTILFEAFPFPLILPIQYATLEGVLAGCPGLEYPRIVKTAGVYAVLIMGLIAAMMGSVKRAELNFHAEDRL